MFSRASPQRCLTRSVIYSQKRYRVKRKWASNQKEKSPSQLALGHFDTYYPPVYQKRWPSVRLALLSQQKYCALMNNFADTTDVEVDLYSNGADDIMKIVRDTDYSAEYQEEKPVLQRSKLSSLDGAGRDSNPSRYGEAAVEGDIPVYDPKDIHQYMPVKRVLSDKEELFEAELSQSIYRPSNIEVNVTDEKDLHIPQTLKAFTFPRGDVRLFPPPSKDENNKLSHYLLDAASLLPVLALDLGPGDDVLDLCAAPGGKSLAILQTLLPDSLTCVDHSFSRLRRLKDVLLWYTPRSFHVENKVDVVHQDAANFCRNTEKQFRKILLDVPCYTDRHILHEDQNNIFRKSRMEERLNIQDIQKNLLVAGLKLLSPGGSLVYSTCTLSMPQNDGTVQAALEDIWQNTDLDVAVVRTPAISDRFRDFFHFHDNCRLGQLVIPNVTANFGPSYFCKLRRVN